MNDLHDNRPDPDEILASIIKEEEQKKRGKLKIFFGMCAGVGKTYSMLRTALADKEKGIDIVIGYVESHNRKETLALIEGLEQVQRKFIEYKGKTLQEMDLDGILKRKPKIVLVDELAHSNVTGSRHSKRYQDVQEILDNGINVFTTVNVQHLESRSDTVAQITGITVRETIPDEIFETADEVELVDITPEELLERFAEGKVYAPERSKEALQNFFRKGNITALREMSLRIVADRVDKQLRIYMQQKHIPGPWKSGMHLLAVIGPSPHSARLIRWAKNFSYTMGASLTALYIETTKPLHADQKEQLNKNLDLARQFGAEIITKSGDDMVKATLSVAQKENITHIIIGKPQQRSLYSFFILGNFVQKLIRYSGNIDVYVLGSDTSVDKHHVKKHLSFPVFTSGISQYILASIIVILCSAVCFNFGEYLGYQSVSFTLLFAVSILATFMGIGPILLASSLSAFIWDFFFIPPRFTIHINKTEDALMFGMFFIIALVNGVLTSRVRRQEKLTRDREERTNALYQLTKELANAENMEKLIEIAVKDIKKHFGLDAVFILQDGNNQLSEYARDSELKILSEKEMSVAEWVFKHSRKAGKYTDTLPSNRFTFYPLPGNRIKPGVVAVKHYRPLHGENEEFWNTFLTQVSNTVERDFLDDLARKALFLDESDKLYKTLFSSISHELRIPVTTIMCASDSLLTTQHSPEIRNELSREILKASRRLNRLIENLLNMSRLESGRITPRIDWCDIHDLINKVTESLQDELKQFNLLVVIPDEMPFVKIDFGLMEQVLYNLIYNATQYATPLTNIRVKAFYDNGIMTLQVMDRGQGLPKEELSRIFDKFHRVEGSKTGGTGLGLSIAKGFVEAHKGTIMAENRQNGGAKFTIKIPSEIPKSGFKG
ncbi:MAG TPA: sensor histidine kinase KdpD [Bacteroidales bacterium]|nr:sensor histidine kinase KdpD [Bacteroidales bacterium]HPT21444.1 sensor histidine kinase KdpD [Bacteroidales bacterium]